MPNEDKFLELEMKEFPDNIISDFNQLLKQLSDFKGLLTQLKEAATAPAPAPAAGAGQRTEEYNFEDTVPKLLSLLDRIEKIGCYAQNKAIAMFTALISAMNDCKYTLQSNCSISNSDDLAYTLIPTSRLRAAAAVYDQITGESNSDRLTVYAKATELLDRLELLNRLQNYSADDNDLTQSDEEGEQRSPSPQSTASEETVCFDNNNPFRKYIEGRERYSQQCLTEIGTLEDKLNTSSQQLISATEVSLETFTGNFGICSQPEEEVKACVTVVESYKENLLSKITEIEENRQNEALFARLEYLKLRCECIDMALAYLNLYPVPRKGTLTGYLKTIISASDCHNKQKLWSLLLCSPTALYEKVSQILPDPRGHRPIVIERLDRSDNACRILKIAAIHVLSDGSGTANLKQDKLVTKGRKSPGESILADLCYQLDDEYEQQAKVGSNPAQSNKQYCRSYCLRSFNSVRLALEDNSETTCSVLGGGH